MKNNKELLYGVIASVILVLALYTFSLLWKAEKVINKVDKVEKVVIENLNNKEYIDSTKVIVEEVGDSIKSKIRKYIRQ